MAIIHGVPTSERELLNKSPREVKNVSDIDRISKDLKNQLKNAGFFGRIKNWYKILQLKKFEKLKKDSMYVGAKGELQVLKELSKLSNDHYILCGVKLELSHYKNYRNKRIKSIQIDFVVVSKYGVFVIEVKNWSTWYYKHNQNFSPHEQTEIAGFIMSNFLKSTKPIHVTKILIPIRENIKDDRNFKNINVKNLKTLNLFLTKQTSVFTDAETIRIVNRLKKHVTR